MDESQENLAEGSWANDSSQGTAKAANGLENDGLWMCPFGGHRKKSCKTRFKTCARLREHFGRVHEKEVKSKCLDSYTWAGLCELTKTRSPKWKPGKYDRIREYVEQRINPRIIETQCSSECIDPILLQSGNGYEEQE